MSETFLFSFRFLPSILFSDYILSEPHTKRCIPHTHIYRQNNGGLIRMEVLTMCEGINQNRRR